MQLNDEIRKLNEIPTTAIEEKGTSVIVFEVDMTDTGCDLQVWDDDYNNRFKHEVWFRPGKVLTRE